MNNLKQFIDSGVIKFAHQKQNRILTAELARQGYHDLARKIILEIK
jgi:hypothetical protein